MEQEIPLFLETQIPIELVRRLERHALRFMSGYREKLDGPLLDFAMKKYSSHRRIPIGTYELLKSEFNLKEEKKKHVKNII